MGGTGKTTDAFKTNQRSACCCCHHNLSLGVKEDLMAHFVYSDDILILLKINRSELQAAFH